MLVVLTGFVLTGCGQESSTTETVTSTTEPKSSVAKNVKKMATKKQDETTGTSKEQSEFKIVADRFADLRLLRYRIPGFETLSLERKTELYYLYEAALSGRDISWDQNYRYNLRIRNILEQIVKNYSGDRTSELFKNFMVYTKRVWFSSGIHHHYSNNKFTPAFSFDEFKSLVDQSVDKGLAADKKLALLIDELKQVMFDATFDAKKVSKAKGVDKVIASAVNFYEGVTQKEVEDFYAAKPKGNTPPSWGLNSKLVKENGKLVEKIWKVGGMYSPAIEQIVAWLEKAVAFSETPEHKDSLEKLIKYYRSGDLKDFDEYNIAWVKDIKSSVDTVNGFIEVYSDPLAYRGSYESVVSFRDEEATKVISAIADNAQWFEDNSSIMDEHKKKKVKGISGKVITVVVESGDASPSTPIGINLPNSNWIRAGHGSKSVSLGNIVDTYSAARGKTLEEFAYSEAEIARSKKYGELASKLHTDMHEVIGHASGRLNKGVGTPKETLKQYSSTMEEARADLVGLYFLMDPKMIELGLVENLEAGKASYDRYFRNGMMTQLYRLEPGDEIEEDHMRNRQLVASWVFERAQASKAVEKIIRDSKTYFIVNDYQKVRELFGELLKDMQRIKSEGDFGAAQELVETYGVKVDSKLHKEVLQRYRSLDVAPYSGFINPVLVAVREGDKITDVKVEYPESFVKQMLYYSENYGFLPMVN